MLPLLSAPLNHLLAQSDWASQRLRIHAGRVLAVHCAPFVLRLQITPDGLFTDALAGSDNDVTITLPADTPLRLLGGQDSLLAAASLQGPADLSETLAFVFRNLRWDAEADLAKLTGDILAFRLIRIIQSIFAAQKRAAGNLQTNLVEYLVDEQRLLPQTPELGALRAGNEDLGLSLSRLESRIQALRQ